MFVLYEGPFPPLHILPLNSCSDIRQWRSYFLGYILRMFLINEFKFYCISLDLSSLNRNSIYFFQQPEHLKFPKSAEKNLTPKFILLSGIFELKKKRGKKIPDAEIEMALLIWDWHHNLNFRSWSIRHVLKTFAILWKWPREKDVQQNWLTVDDRRMKM